MRLIIYYKKESKQSASLLAEANTKSISTVDIANKSEVQYNYLAPKPSNSDDRALYEITSNPEIKTIRLAFPNFLFSWFASIGYKYVKNTSNNLGLDKKTTISLIRNCIKQIRRTKEHITIIAMDNDGEGVYIRI